MEGLTLLLELVNAGTIPDDSTFIRAAVENTS